MNRSEIKVDGFYTAEVGGQVTVVQVVRAYDIRSKNNKSYRGYDVIVLNTGERKTIRSEADFHCERPAQPTIRINYHH